MSKHTPGPWSYASAAACAEIEVMEIAEVAHMRVIPAAEKWPTPGAPEDDARLMAAAPELLQALQAIVKCWERGEPFTDSGNQIGSARAAIRKATGAE